MTPAPWAIVAALTLLAVAALAAVAGRRLLAAFGLKLVRDDGEPPAVRPTADAQERAAAVQPGRIGGMSDIADLEVSDVMVHRMAMRMVDAEAPPAAGIREIRRRGDAAR